MITQDLTQAWRDAWSVPDRRPMWQWAEEFVYLPAGVLTVTGFFSVQRSRHFIEIFDALQNDLIRVVTLLKPVRQGGSLIGDIWLPWTIVNNPGPFMWNMQEGPSCTWYAENRIMPVLEGCAPVVKLFPANHHQKRKESIVFSNGAPLHIQPCSVTALQSRGTRYQLNDEVWLWPAGRLAQALGRLGDYEEINLSKCFIVSQGGNEGEELDVVYQKGDQREWDVECAGCRKHFPPASFGFRDDGSRWGFRWDDNERTKNKSGLWNVEAIVESLRYECRECGHGHVDQVRTKSNWNLTGRYRVTNPRHEIDHASFHWYGAIGRAWEKMAKELAFAENCLKHGNLQPFINLIQKREARGWSERILHEFSPGRRVVYEVDSAWPEEVHRFLTIDKQADGLFWGVARAWSSTGKSRRIWFGKLYGWGEVRAKQLELKIEDSKTLIDGGWDAKGPDGVYAACSRYGWVCLRGDPKRKSFLHAYRANNETVSVEKSFSQVVYGDPEIGQHNPTQGLGLARLIWFAVTTVADRLFKIRQTDLWQDPKSDPDDEMEKEYGIQMRAEYPKTERDPITGQLITTWVCPSGNNHAWDCEKMQYVAAMIMGDLPDTFEDRPPEVALPAPEPAAA